MNGWIKCNDQLPTENGNYLVLHNHGNPQVLAFCDGHWNCHRSHRTGVVSRKHEITNVVAWQPIEPFEDDCEKGTV